MYKVLLKNNITGEERVYPYDGDWDVEEASHYLWTDGNYGCDCNRHILFSRAIGEEPEDNMGCGDTHYSALYAELPDGTRVELD